MKTENIDILQKENLQLRNTVKKYNEELEERNWEAQIEVALEKVRSRSMAMDKSTELVRVVKLLDKEIRGLGIEIDSSQILTDLDENEHSAIVWIAADGNDYLEKFHIPYIAHPITDRLIDASNRGLDFYTEKYSKAEKNEFFRLLFKFSDFRKIPKKRQEWILNSSAMVRATVIFKNTILIFFRYNFQEFTNHEEKLFKRFAKVFEQTYTRFLDLKKAEAQAREAQIEGALERVRSRSTGMHKSEELVDVVQQMNKEIIGLGIEIDTTQICTDLTSDPRDGMNNWISVEGSHYLEKFHIPFLDHPLTAKLYENLENQNDCVTVKCSKTEKNDYFKLLFEHSDFKNILEERKKFVLSAPGWVICGVYLQNTLVQFARYNLQEFTREEEEIFKRLGNVFGQSYTRFLDLKKAEKQASEAIKQASLDRVRGEIASMRSTRDLENITPLLWNELTTLGIPFIRCGVFIIHEDEQQIEVYLSKPDGTSLAVMHLPFASNELATKTLEAWRKKEIYTQQWSKQEFLDFGRRLMEQNQVSNMKTYQGSEEAPESLNLHFIPFNQGMLYVGSTTFLNDEEIDLAASLVKTFSIAYARYEDFVKLEKAKAGIEAALTELKATQTQLVQQEKLASLGQLTAGIAHEIKNPLNFVNNFSELSSELIDEAFEEMRKMENCDAKEETLAILKDVKENLIKIYEHGSRANNIVSSMLQHSRGGSGKMEPTHLNALVKEYVNLSFHGMRAGKNPINVSLEYDLEESIGKVPLVAEDFSRVIVNLCNNAFDAMRETANNRPPKLTLRTRMQSGKIIIEVEDNGPGIPKEIKDKILQPFFTTKKGTEGTGLGLSLSYDIIKAHNGELKVETTEENGTTFIISLPLNKSNK